MPDFRFRLLMPLLTLLRHFALLLMSSLMPLSLLIRCRHYFSPRCHMLFFAMLITSLMPV